MFADPTIGIFVIVLGVMVWTSRKSRRAERPERAEDEAWQRPRGGPAMPAARIMSVRRDKPQKPPERSDRKLGG